MTKDKNKDNIKKEEEVELKQPKPLKLPNKDAWAKIFNSVEDPNEPPMNVPLPEVPRIPDSHTIDPVDSIHRTGRNDMFTKNAVVEDETWKVHTLTEFRSMIVAKPVSKVGKYDDRLLFIIPYTTVTQNNKKYDLYYCIIENHTGDSNEIFEFSILSSGEIMELFGIDLDTKSYSGVLHATDKIIENLDDIIELRKHIKDPNVLKSVISNIIKS